MKWLLLVVVVLVVLVAAIAFIGTTLPRDHVASRSLALRRPAEEVWLAIMQATAASGVPVDVVESDPPRRQVTCQRHGEEFRRHLDDYDHAVADRQHPDDHRGRLGGQPDFPLRVALRDGSSRDDGRDAQGGREAVRRATRVVRHVTARPDLGMRP